VPGDISVVILLADVVTLVTRCSSSGNLRLIRHFEKRDSGSSGL
jgi:hypothetical protein